MLIERCIVAIPQETNMIHEINTKKGSKKGTKIDGKYVYSKEQKAQYPNPRNK